MLCLDDHTNKTCLEPRNNDSIFYHAKNGGHVNSNHFEKESLNQGDNTILKLGTLSSFYACTFFHEVISTVYFLFSPGHMICLLNQAA